MFYLTQYIETVFDTGQITCVALVDLTIAYDTVQHNILLYKHHQATNDTSFRDMICTLLKNRRFYVEFSLRRIWWSHKNGLLQGIVLPTKPFHTYRIYQAQSESQEASYILTIEYWHYKLNT